MFLATCFAFALSLTAYPDSTGNPDFDFYLGELIEDEREDKDPTHKLVAGYLAEAILQANSNEDFQNYLQVLNQAVREHPERHRRFRQLDRALQTGFQEKLKAAKKKRLIYAASGAIIGALVGIPVGRMLNSSKLIWISIPAGALAGGGLGFLLGNLIAKPDYEYEAGSIHGTHDLDAIADKLLDDDF